VFKLFVVRQLGNQPKNPRRIIRGGKTEIKFRHEVVVSGQLSVVSEKRVSLAVAGSSMSCREKACGFLETSLTRMPSTDNRN
jgi:hypothetical protein